jgi:predicted AAA+ superfamily ATPase
MIPRVVQQNVIKSLRQWRKLVLVLGPRQSGKTTVVKNLQKLFESQKQQVLYLNCDLEEHIRAIDTTSITVLSKILKGVDYLLADEAQRLKNPGLTFKIIYDNFPKTRVVATGSSSFELKNQMSDAMTGRYVDFGLYPLSLAEIQQYEKPANIGLLVNDLLLYGEYPEVYLLKQFDLKKILLAKIGESYLFKDILAFSRIRNSQAVTSLSRALAYQIGSEINENELSGRIKIDRKTLVSYLDILEKAFVIYRLYPYSQNPRREIGRRYKVYFVDLGIRNMLIGDFNPMEVRGDGGKLWENFLVMERVKLNANRGGLAKPYFWRSYNGAEVDYLEVGGGKTMAWEIKDGNRQSLSRGAKVFAKTYEAGVKLINRTNFESKFLEFE